MVGTKPIRSPWARNFRDSRVICSGRVMVSIRISGSPASGAPEALRIRLQMGAKLLPYLRLQVRRLRLTREGTRSDILDESAAGVPHGVADLRISPYEGGHATGGEAEQVVRHEDL